MLHHMMIARATVIALFLIYSLLVASSNPVFRWSMATAYVGVTVLGLTLAIGPLNVLPGRPNRSHRT